MKTIILLLLSVSLSAQPLRIHFEKDTEGTAKHVWAGIGVNVAVGTLVYAKTKNTTLSCISGFLAGIAAGIIKEAVWDKRFGYGVCSNNDAYSTFWGSAVGFPILRVGIDVYERKQFKNEGYFENLGPGMQVVDTLVIAPGDTTFLVEPKPIKYN